MAEVARKMNIYEAISRCMEEIGAVGKDAENEQQHFKYRGIDAVMNAINPVLTKNHVFIVPEVLEQRREERTKKSGGALIYSICRIKYTFYAEDGSFIEAVTVERAWTVEIKQPTRQWRLRSSMRASRYFAFRPRR